MELGDLRKRLSAVAEGYAAQKVILFGSHARGTNDRHSDIDLIIIDNEELPYLRRLDKYFDDISEALHAPFDLFVYSEAEFDRMKDRPFLRKAMQEGVVLYER